MLAARSSAPAQVDHAGLSRAEEDPPVSAGTCGSPGAGTSRSCGPAASGGGPAASAGGSAASGGGLAAPDAGRPPCLGDVVGRAPVAAVAVTGAAAASGTAARAR